MNSVETSLGSNPKEFWSFINKTKPRAQIPDCMSFNDLFLNNPRDR